MVHPPQFMGEAQLLTQHVNRQYLSADHDDEISLLPLLNQVGLKLNTHIQYSPDTVMSGPLGSLS